MTELKVAEDPLLDYSQVLPPPPFPPSFPASLVVAVTLV